jgi:nucleotide-binding universal stress UspA family protein
MTRGSSSPTTTPTTTATHGARAAARRGGADLSPRASATHSSPTASARPSRARARELLDHGAAILGDPDVPRHVIVHASTGDGLRELALREGADLVVFGSDYRTAPARSPRQLRSAAP